MVNEAELRVVFDAALAEPLLSTRMHGDHYGDLLGNCIDSADDLNKFCRGIDVRRAVKRQNAKGLPTFTIVESELITDARLLGEGNELKERVNHES